LRILDFFGAFSSPADCREDVATYSKFINHRQFIASVLLSLEGLRA